MKKIKLLVAVSFVAIFSSCTSDPYENNNSYNQKDPITIDPDPNPDPIIPKVYISGFNSEANNDFATEWIDGIQNDFSSAPDIAKSIHVSNFGDVYKAGQSEGMPVYWENNTKIQLTCSGYTYGEANSIFINGSDVYVTGHMTMQLPNENRRIAMVWKNGVATTLSTNDSNGNSVFVSGSDVYVAGWESLPNFRKARLWKNNVLVTLNTTANYNCEATSVFVRGTNVYVAGSGKKIYINGQDPLELSYRARYWKNGIETVLPDSDYSRHNYANSIYVATDNKIYVAGYDNIDNACCSALPNVTRAKYWKNGLPVVLTDGATSSARANSIFVFGADVFVAGWSGLPGAWEGTPTTAVTWNNGIMNTLSYTDGHAEATSIFVKAL